MYLNTYLEYISTHLFEYVFRIQNKNILHNTASNLQDNWEKQKQTFYLKHGKFV